jgi:hypothetical protein
MTAIEQKRLLEKLAEDPGYLALQSILQQQVDQLQNEILFTVCSSLDMAITAEYKKGQLEGRLAVEQLRITAIDNLKLDIERIQKDEHRNDDSSDAGTSDDLSGSSDGLAP